MSALPAMYSGHWGRIVNFASTSGLFGMPTQPNYASAKMGVVGLTYVAANTLGKYGVTANAIMPSGATRMIDSTPRGKAFYEENGKWPSEMAVGSERDPDNVAPLNWVRSDISRAASV